MKIVAVTKKHECQHGHKFELAVLSPKHMTADLWISSPYRCPKCDGQPSFSSACWLTFEDGSKKPMYDLSFDEVTNIMDEYNSIVQQQSEDADKLNKLNKKVVELTDEVEALGIDTKALLKGIKDES